MSFTCPECKTLIGDPHYHGPLGHAPQNVCFTCWVNHWATVEAMIWCERGNWQLRDVALVLLALGFTHAEAADILHIHPASIGRYIRRLRKKPEEIPDWLLARPQFCAKK